MSASIGSENGQAFVTFVRGLAGEWYCPMCGTHFIPPERPYPSHCRWSHTVILPVQLCAECPVCRRILTSSGEYADAGTREKQRGHR